MRLFLKPFVFVLALWVSQGQATFQWGGAAFFSPGATTAWSSDLDRNLRLSRLTDDDVGIFSWELGAGALFLVSKRLVVLMDGFVTYLPDIEESTAQFNRELYGGGVGLGYAVVNAWDGIFYPSISVGLIKNEMSIHNRSGVRQNFGGLTLPIDETTPLSFTQPYIDVGVHAHGMVMFFEERGGLDLGASFGMWMGISESDFENESGDKVSGFRTERLYGIYLRVHAGLGWFVSEP